jgi:hypothetical protein
MYVLFYDSGDLGIGDWGLGIGDWPNPQSHFLKLKIKSKNIFLIL